MVDPSFLEYVHVERHAERRAGKLAHDLLHVGKNMTSPDLPIGNSSNRLSLARCVEVTLQVVVFVILRRRWTRLESANRKALRVGNDESSIRGAVAHRLVAAIEVGRTLAHKCFCSVGRKVFFRDVKYNRRSVAERVARAGEDLAVEV